MGAVRHHGSVQIIDGEQRRARLARRHRIAPGHRAADVEAATAAMVCLHATDPATLYLSAWARLDAMTVADLDRALYTDRTLVKHLAMRRTLFVFPRASLAAVQAGASERVEKSERERLIRQVAQAGLVPDATRWFADASAAVLAVLAERDATAAALRAEIPLLEGAIMYGEGKSWGGPVAIGPRVLTSLSAAGRIVRGANRGAWTTSAPTWTTPERWLGHAIEQLPGPLATAQLVEHWLRVFGPGTVEDVKWWLGSTLTAVRRALADVGAVEVEIEGRTGYVLPDDLDPVDPVEPWVALLPSLDPTIMGWYERDWYLGPHRRQLFDTFGNAGPTAWCDGRAVGAWRQSPSGEVLLDLLDDVGAEAEAALEAEAARLTGWLDGVRLAPRFPSPLSRTTGPPMRPGRAQRDAR